MVDTSSDIFGSSSGATNQKGQKNTNRMPDILVMGAVFLFLFSLLLADFVEVYARAHGFGGSWEGQECTSSGGDQCQLVIGTNAILFGDETIMHPVVFEKSGDHWEIKQDGRQSRTLLVTKLNNNEIVISENGTFQTYSRVKK